MSVSLPCLCSVRRVTTSGISEEGQRTLKRVMQDPYKDVCPATVAEGAAVIILLRTHYVWAREATAVLCSFHCHCN